MKITRLLFLLLLCLQTRQIFCMNDSGSTSESDELASSSAPTTSTDTDQINLMSDDNGVLPDPAENGDSDIEDDGGQPIEPIQPTKKIWHRPTGYIGLAFLSCALSVIGMVKLYTWYHTPQQVDQEEEDEIDERIA